MKYMTMPTLRAKKVGRAMAPPGAMPMASDGEGYKSLSHSHAVKCTLSYWFAAL